MAFASTDRMDGIPGGYNRPSVRGSAPRGGAAEGFDRILSAAGAREPQAADARSRTGAAGVQARTTAQRDEDAAPTRRDTAAQAPTRTDARRDASDPGTDAASRAQVADRRADAAAAGGAEADAGAAAVTETAEPNAAKSGAAKSSAEESNAAEAAPAEAVPPGGPDGSRPAAGAKPGADSISNGQPAAQPAPVPQEAIAAQAALSGATAVQVRPNAETQAVAPKTEEPDSETEEAPADPTAPLALPAFLALLAAPPPPALAGADAGAAAAPAGGLPGTTAQSGGAGATATGGTQLPGRISGQAFGQVPGQMPGQVPQGAASQSFGAAAGIPGLQAGGVQGAEDGKTESAVPTDAGAAKEPGAKPDLFVALAGAVAEPGAAAAGQAPGHGLAQAAAQATAQGIGQTAPAHAAAHAAGSAAASATVPATPPVQIGQVPMTIGLRALSGSSQFEIRLDPLDLGRIEVKLEIDKERGTVMTHMVVERIETLAMLQRDAGSLQQALSQAGLDAQEGGINLSLRGDGQSEGRTGDQAGGQDNRAPRGAWVPETERVAEAPLRMLRGLGGLDIRI